jgi:DNA-3-methyladenine glycosylase
MKKLTRSFYERDALEVAPALLGKYLVREHGGVRQVVRVVEVEAYLGPHDLAAHSSRGRTPRTEVMFGPPGHAYVYMVYGLHYCLNAVTAPAGNAQGVLIRAVEPIQNLSGRTQGPGLVCRAFGIDRSANGIDLCGAGLYLAARAEDAPLGIVRRPRIGVDYAGHWARRLLRFYVRGNPFISRP